MIAAKLHFRLKKETARATRAQHRLSSCVDECRIYETVLEGVRAARVIDVL